MAPEKRGDLVAIAADGHGAPAAAVGARIVIEEEPARGIGADTHRCVGAFDDQLGGGTRNGGEKPFKATFAGDEFQSPTFGAGDEFVVAFSEAKQIVDGFDPAFGERLFGHEGREDGADRFAQTKDFQEHGVHGLRLGLEPGVKAGRSLGGDDAGVDEE